MLPRYVIALLAGSALTFPALAAAKTPAAHGQSEQGERSYVPAIAPPDAVTSLSDERLAVFAPTSNPIRHTIDYEIWDFALKRMIVAMGPSNRQSGRRPDPSFNTRLKHGPQSRYRLEGSLVLFRFFDKDVIASLTEYRQDLERVVDTLDISTLPRNEQLAFWLNLHNVALLEQIALEWPVREPRTIMRDGVPLDDAKFITLRGIPVSLRDIREEIVFRHWNDPKVIYGFWRGEIGGPELQRHAFTGGNVSSLLDFAATDFVNSLRGTQKRGDRLEVSELYADVAPFYFPDFDRDVRAHLGKYAEKAVAEILAETTWTTASVSETDIADLHGGARRPGYLPVPDGCYSTMGEDACELMQAREIKLRDMRRRGQQTTRVFFSNIDLPGDPPNKNAVE